MRRRGAAVSSGDAGGCICICIVPCNGAVDKPGVMELASCTKVRGTPEMILRGAGAVETRSGELASGLLVSRFGAWFENGLVVGFSEVLLVNLLAKRTSAPRPWLLGRDRDLEFALLTWLAVDPTRTGLVGRELLVKVGCLGVVIVDEDVSVCASIGVGARCGGK